MENLKTSMAEPVLRKKIPFSDITNKQNMKKRAVSNPVKNKKKSIPNNVVADGKIQKISSKRTSKRNVNKNEKQEVVETKSKISKTALKTTTQKIISNDDPKIKFKCVVNLVREDFSKLRSIDKLDEKFRQNLKVHIIRSDFSVHKPDKKYRQNLKVHLEQNDFSKLEILEEKNNTKQSNQNNSVEVSDKRTDHIKPQNIVVKRSLRQSKISNYANLRKNLVNNEVMEEIKKVPDKEKSSIKTSGKIVKKTVISETKLPKRTEQNKIESSKEENTKNKVVKNESSIRKGRIRKSIKSKTVESTSVVTKMQANIKKTVNIVANENVNKNDEKKGIIMKSNPNSNEQNKVAVSTVKPKILKQKLERKVIKGKTVETTSVGSGIKKKLRQRKTRNYAEISLNTTNKSTPLNTVEKSKVPIYKREIVEQKPNNNKKTDDLYEFDSDSEKEKKKRRKNLNDSSKYDKTIHEIMQKLTKKVKAKKPSKKVTVPVSIKNKNMNKNVHIVIERNNTNLQKIKDMLPAPKKLLSPVKTKPNATVNNINKEDDNANITHVENLENNVEMDIFPDNDCEPFNDSDNESVHKEEKDSLQKLNDIFNLDESPIKKNPLNILSNVVIKRRINIPNDIDSPQKFKRPNANSTMISPWRFNTVTIRRNPHYIQLKKSALPSVQQEPVLDHTLEDKLDSISKTPKQKTDKPPSPVQQSILNYVSSSNTDKDFYEKQTNCNISLFDINELSPIKNFGNKINTPKPDLVRRKVLGDQTNAQNLESTPLKEPNDGNRISYFGFDEFTPVNKGNKENVVEGPFRINLKVAPKTYNKALKNKHSLDATKNNIVEVNEDMVNIPDEEVEDHGHVGLFEDFEPLEQPEKQYTRKRRARIYPIDEEDDDLKPKKKKKDVRTKAEEEAARKWAEAFNSMCDEIEKHVLEIE